MGREHGTEERASGTASTVQSGRYYLVGAPGVGKGKLAEALAERFDERLYFYEDNYYLQQYALDTVADYRIELALALKRWEQENTNDPTIFSHSILDNLAYITFAVSRYSLKTVALGTAERAVLTMGIIGALITDSFKYDHVFFLQGDFDPNEDYEQYELQSILQMILDQYQINYSIIEADEQAEEKIAEVLEGYLGG